MLTQSIHDASFVCCTNVDSDDLHSKLEWNNNRRDVINVL